MIEIPEAITLSYQITKTLKGKKVVRVCGGNIIKETYQGGSIYHCEGCQLMASKK